MATELFRFYVGKGRRISVYKDCIIIEYYKHHQIINARYLVGPFNVSY